MTNDHGMKTSASLESTPSETEHRHSEHCHSHAHGHAGHSHGSPAAWAHNRGGSRRRLIILTGLSFTYLIAEVVGGLLSGSLALLADAGHMAIDVAAMLLGLFAMWIAKRPPTPEKTFGFYRAEILAALVNGASLLAISFWIFMEAYHRLSAPQPIQGGLMLGVSLGGLVVNGIGLLLVHSQSRSDLNFRGIWLHLLTDTLSSVGSLVAAVAVLWFGWRLADPLVSILIAAFILFGSWQLLGECVNVLLEGVPRGMNIHAIRNGIESFPAVDEVHDLHVWTVSSGVPALSAHVRIKEYADYSRALEGILELLRKDFQIEHATLQLEPALFDHSDDAHLHP